MCLSMLNCFRGRSSKHSQGENQMRPGPDDDCEHGVHRGSYGATATMKTVEVTTSALSQDDSQSTHDLQQPINNPIINPTINLPQGNVQSTSAVEDRDSAFDNGKSGSGVHGQQLSTNTSNIDGEVGSQATQQAQPSSQTLSSSSSITPPQPPSSIFTLSYPRPQSRRPGETTPAPFNFGQPVHFTHPGLRPSDPTRFSFTTTPASAQSSVFAPSISNQDSISPSGGVPIQFSRSSSTVFGSQGSSNQSQETLPQSSQSTAATQLSSQPFGASTRTNSNRTYGTITEERSTLPSSVFSTTSFQGATPASTFTQSSQPFVPPAPTPPTFSAYQAAQVDLPSSQTHQTFSQASTAPRRQSPVLLPGPTAPPRCIQCGLATTLRGVQNFNRNNNVGRAYYKCDCGYWASFADNIGNYSWNPPCRCDLSTRRQQKNGSSSHFYRCRVGACRFFEWESAEQKRRHEDMLDGGITRGVASLRL